MDRAEEELYAIAGQEIASKNVRQGIFAKAYVLASGDETNDVFPGGNALARNESSSDGSRRAAETRACRVCESWSVPNGG